jgi:branched-chain amino acid transport system ATP-binding protein
MILNIRNLSVDIEGKPVLRDISLTVGEDDFIAVLGHNGAGKTTLLRTVLGLWKARTGKITFQGKDITNQPTSRIVRLGISMVPQLRGYFEDLTVEDNLSFGYRRGGSIGYDEVYELFPALADRKKQIVGTLSGGQRQMVAVAIALMSSPKLLLLDEPSVGLQPNLVASMMDVATTLNREFDIAIVLVEQNVQKAVEVARQVFILNQGELVYSSLAGEVSRQDIWQLL